MIGIRVNCPDTDAEIVGVVKDFNYQDLTHPIEPLAFYCSGEPSREGDLTPRYFRAEVKTVEGKSGEVAGRLAGILHKIGGTKDARVSLLISSARKLYSGNAAESALVKTSSIFSLLLALLGIFGLVYLEAQTIRKEVAIRKVMGASTKDLIWMMARKYIVFGTVVFAVSVPLGIWIISRWMEQFSEKAPVSVWIFLLAWLIVIGTTVAVISSMALVVSRTNPATELKKE
ncbi:MAG: FtsX-like permease family protein, partial [Bacteroidales bacterium]|nr:FtsX-like permease family protein [Bacteroidales bacterium]